MHRSFLVLLVCYKFPAGAEGLDGIIAPSPRLPQLSELLRSLHMLTMQLQLVSKKTKMFFVLNVMRVRAGETW